MQKRGWVGMRAYHDQALIDEPVYDGKAISFAHPVRYDIQGNKLVIVS